MGNNQEELRFNDLVMTPNGVGTLKENFYESGGRYKMVVHKTAEMTSRTHGRRISRGRVGKLDMWVYEESQITKYVPPTKKEVT